MRIFNNTTTLHSLALKQCNEEFTDIDFDKVKVIRQRIKNLLPNTYIEFQSDPRGPTTKIFPLNNPNTEPICGFHR